MDIREDAVNLLESRFFPFRLRKKKTGAKRTASKFSFGFYLQQSGPCHNYWLKSLTVVMNRTKLLSN